MKKFVLLGYQITVWFWKDEKRVNNKCLSGIGIIVEKLP